ncbi:MAG: Rrf2 family transcriptional regulator [Elainellaceae cyanobacterium]
MVLELTCKCEYCLLALLELAAVYTSHQPLQIRQIATRQSIPERYLEQLLLALKRGGLVQSQRGMNGGYRLTRSPQTISLLDVLNCIEGKDSTQSDRTSESGCLAIHEIWDESYQAAQDVLAQHTLCDILEQRLELTEASNQMYYI